MAKKVKEIYIDDKPEQMLLPVDTQPYVVPDNWCWVTVNGINEYRSKNINPMDKGDTVFELYSVPSYDENYPEILSGSEIGSSKQLVQKNDVLICKINPKINRVWLVKDYEKGQLLASSEWIVVRNEVINSKYLMYYFRSQTFREYLLSNVSGVGGSLMRAQPKYVETYPIPLPPNAEQQRIVEQIEQLFEMLDKAADIISDILDISNKRKHTILNKALSGELTSGWRNRNSINLESWQERTLESVCFSIYDGDHMPPPKSETGIHFLVISNINEGYLSFDNTRYVPEEYYNKLSETRKPRLGDLLYSTVGSYGIPVIVDDERPFCFQRHLALLKPKCVNTNFLWYVLQSKMMYQKATEIATGTAQLTVPIQGLRKLSFKMPILDEQIKIVEIMDAVFDAENKIKDEINDAIEAISLMKKSILAKAFRGELSTTDLSEPSYMDLLKSILSTEI